MVWAKWALRMDTLVPLSSRSVGSWALAPEWLWPPGLISPKVPVSDWGQLDLITIPKGTQRPGTRLQLMRPCGASAPSSSWGFYQGLEGIRVQLLWQPSPASSLPPICDLESTLTPKISILECFQKPGPSWTLLTTAYASCPLCSFLS